MNKDKELEQKAREYLPFRGADRPLTYEDVIRYMADFAKQCIEQETEEFKQLLEETMETKNDYSKQIQSLKAELKELRERVLKAWFDNRESESDTCDAFELIVLDLTNKQKT